MTSLLLPRDPITDLPILILMVHARCDCRCVMCDIWKTPAPRELTPADVERLAAELGALGVRHVCLTGGEPLLHPRLWPLCEPLVAAGVRLTLLTTGLELEAQAAAVARACDEVIVSLDGPPATHNGVRRVKGAFARLAAGVAALRRAGRQVRVAARCTVQRANFRELRATVRAAADLGLDGISFLAVDAAGGDAFGRAPGWTAPAGGGLVPDDLPALRDELRALQRECAAEFESGFIVERPAKLRRRILRHFAAVHGLVRPAAPLCNAPWVSSVVGPDGSVRPCFFHPPIGNLRDGGLAAAVNSPAAIAFRQSLDVRTNPVCRRCVCSLALRHGDRDARAWTGGAA